MSDGRTGARRRRRTAVVGGLGLAVALLAAAPLAAQAPDAGAVLDGAVVALGRATTLRADFTQRIRDQMLGTDETSTGEFLQQRPGRFAMRWRRPAGDLIVADGKVLWVYLPSSAPKQAVRTNLTGKPGESADFVAEFLDHPRDRFTVSYVRPDTVAAREADVLSLVPRTANVPYQRALIWVDRADSLVRRVEITEGSGSLRRLTFDHLRVNAAIPASAFRFTPPSGVRIVDASE
ncbi:MAG TPA: outer membrane lipoprotein carrier protein LolA [Gemmatimonadales bacterium]|nr:outer membrane lipoprotein carrier protein LolA [Gemmatimonadales bacterium]